MASRTTLNAKNLKALGAEQLAKLLIEISTGNAAAKRKLRLALAGAQGPKEAAREVTKRLSSIARAKSFITWQNRKPLVDDLETQRRAIVEQIAPADPEGALELLWRLMNIATPVFERSDDSSGMISSIFRQACQDLGEVAKAVRPRPQALDEAIFNALQDNGYGQYDGLIGIMAPALGQEGLARLKALVEKLGRTPIPAPPKEQRKTVSWGTGGTRYEHEMDERIRQRMVSVALREIADAQGDVDGFIAQYDAKARKVPKIAAEIAQRLMAAGRAVEALEFIERADVVENRWTSHLDWQDTRLEVLDALGRNEEAQAFRWSCFERNLSTEYLRDYLKRLPDFEDFEAEQKAMAHAAAHPNLLSALHFFLEWPALERAADLLIQRHDKIDGNHYEFLVPAAEALSERHSLAATLALRAMINFTLTNARAKRYGYAAQHLAECAGLTRKIEDFAPFEPHDAYVARLKDKHGRKYGFWSLVKTG